MSLSMSATGSRLSGVAHEGGRGYSGRCGSGATLHDLSLGVDMVNMVCLLGG